MGCDGVFPLARMLLVCPGRAVRLPIGVDALGKRLGIGGFERGGGAAGLTRGDRGLAPEQQRTASAGRAARVGQPEGVYGAQTPVAARPVAEGGSPPCSRPV